MFAGVVRQASGIWQPESAPALMRQGMAVGEFNPPPPPCTNGMACPLEFTGVNRTVPEAMGFPPTFRWLAEMGVSCACPYCPRHRRAKKKRPSFFMGNPLRGHL